jgi:hypothetical protein
MQNLVDDQMYRQRQILGDQKATPPIDPIIPVSPSTWWRGISEGRFPKGIKIATCGALSKAKMLHKKRPLAVTGGLLKQILAPIQIETRGRTLT